MSPSHALIHILPGQHLDQFIREAKAAMESKPFATVLILPTSSLVRSVRRRLMDEDFTFPEAAVTTLEGFAGSLARSYAGDTIRIHGFEKEMIISALLEEGNYPLLAPERQAMPVVADELRVLFDVLQSRTIRYPDALGDLQSRKSSEIGALFSEYTRYINEQKLLDRQALLVRAAGWIAMHGGPEHVFVYGLYEPFPIEKELLIALKRQSVQFFCAVPYHPNSRCFTDDGSWLRIEEITSASHEERTVLSRFFDDFDPERAEVTIRTTAYRNTSDEIHGLASEIKTLIDEGASPGDITLVFPAIADSIQLTDEIFREYGIPYSTSTGKTLSRIPLIRFLLQVLAVVASGYTREDVISLLRSPYFPANVNTGGYTPLPDGSEVDILSRRAGITGGRAEWRDRIEKEIQRQNDRLLRQSGEGERTRRDEIQSMEATMAAIEGLFSTLSVFEGSKTITCHLNTYRQLLRQLNLPAIAQNGQSYLCEEEIQAQRAFEKMLDDLEHAFRIIPEKTITPSAFLSILMSRAAATRIPGVQNRHLVQVIGIREAGHLRIPHLFIAGLNEGIMPGIRTRLPLCTNLETRELQTWTSSEILRQERYYFLAALLSAEKTISLSYPESDGDTILLGSGFLNGLCVEERKETGKPRSPLRAAETAGRLLVRGRYEEAALHLPLHLDIRSLADRITIETYYRHGIPFSRYDGMIGEETSITARLQERFGSSRIYSASAFERYAQCPFSFFMRDVLHIDPLPEVELDLTGLEWGNLIHRIAYRFFTGWKESGGLPLTEKTIQQAVDRIHAICRDELDIIGRKSPVWEVQGIQLLGNDQIGDGLLRDLLLYEMTLSASPFTPAYFESSFGIPLTGEDLAVSTEDPIEIPLHDSQERSVLLRGRIDRIDTTTDGRFCVIDYKTGGSPGYRDIAEGRALQLPLYIRAVERWMGLAGAGGCYYTIRRDDTRCQAVIRDESIDEYFAPFSRSKEGGDRPLNDLIEESLAYVAEYIDGIQNGRFPTVADPKRCPTYCSFSHICRFEQKRLLKEERS